MKRLPLFLAGAVIIAIGSAFTTAPSNLFSGAEQKDFYVFNNGSRSDTEYPSAGTCLEEQTENCHATYQREDPSSDWVRVTEITPGDKPASVGN